MFMFIFLYNPDWLNHYALIMMINKELERSVETIKTWETEYARKIHI